MNLAEAFLSGVWRRMPTTSLSPTVLCEVAAEVLGVDAVGVTTMAWGLRLPVGASTADAFVAEELQTTLGDGPCLYAAHTATAVVAEGCDIERLWPVYGEALTSRTPYRSVAAFPLVAAGELVGAMDLYAVDTDLGTRLDLTRTAHDLGDAVATLLAVCLSQLPSAGEPPGLAPLWYRQSAGRRVEVWVAVGMLLAGNHASMRSRDEALVRLRGYAFGHGLSLDDLAEQLVSGELGLDEVGQEP